MQSHKLNVCDLTNDIKSIAWRWLRVEHFQGNILVNFGRFLVSLFLVLSASANAWSLNEQELVFQYYVPNLSHPYTGASNGSFVVGAGVEVPNVVGNFGSLDVRNNQLLVRFEANSTFTPALFNGWVISGISGELDSVDVDAATSMPGFSSRNVSFNQTSISVNWQGLSFSAGQSVVLNLAGAVPEPGTSALLLIGFAVVAAAARRRSAVFALL